MNTGEMDKKGGACINEDTEKRKKGWTGEQTY